MKIDFNRDPYRRRGYLHFDLPNRPDAVERYACNPKKVETHSFYPFILAEKCVRKLKRRPKAAETDTLAETDYGIRNSKPRPIRYAAHLDAAIYAHYAKLLNSSYESILRRLDLDQCPTAFRMRNDESEEAKGGWTNAKCAGEVFKFIDAQDDCIVIASDITEFFDNLDHLKLKNEWGRLLEIEKLPRDHFQVFKSLTTYASVDQQKVFEQFKISKHNPKARESSYTLLRRRRICSPKEFRYIVRPFITCNDSGKGIPQGSPISALLSNIYMLPFDTAMSDYAQKVGGFYRRYCDDILLVVPPTELQVARQIMQEAVDERKLKINPSKDKIHRFKRTIRGLEIEQCEGTSNGSLQYLGFEFNGKHTFIRSGTFHRFYRKMRRGVIRAKLATRRVNKIRTSIHGVPGRPPKTRKLYLAHSYLGKWNFISYVMHAEDYLVRPKLRSQARRHWGHLLRLISLPLHSLMHGFPSVRNRKRPPRKMRGKDL